MFVSCLVVHICTSSLKIHIFHKIKDSDFFLSSFYKKMKYRILYETSTPLLVSSFDLHVLSICLKVG